MVTANRTTILLVVLIGVLTVLFPCIQGKEPVVQFSAAFAGQSTSIGAPDDTHGKTGAIPDTSAVDKAVASLELDSRELTPEMMERYPGGNYIHRTVRNNAWYVGENLEFEITYSFFNAGTATMSVLDVAPVNGGDCYHIQTTARSNDFISTFYKVRDVVNSYIDSAGIFSRRIEKKLREGRYKADRYVDFYPDRLIALSTRDKYALTEIPLYVQDILSSLYFIRTCDLDVGNGIDVVTYADGKVYPLKVLIHKREKVTVPAGTFTCLKIEPLLKSEGIFRQKGKLVIWVTDDKNKIPVKMESKVLIGSIASKLVSYQTGTEK